MSTDTQEEKLKRQYRTASALAPLKFERERLLKDKEQADMELRRIDRMIERIERDGDIDDDLRRVIDSHMWRLHTDGDAHIATASAYLGAKDVNEFVRVGITLSFPSMASAQLMIGKDNLETL